MVGNSKYIALGGKFSRASGGRSKGWPEWPIPSIASNKVGPVGGPSAIGLATDPEPTAGSLWRGISCGIATT